MNAYYNENDLQKAAWLRELIRENVIAPGEVDERSITEVDSRELLKFRQCHFFAGIGVWSYALRLAGWPDDRPVWTGSCPCPSFSCAGKGRGFDDPRHLWPTWDRHIEFCRPATIFGEQADDAIGFGWLDLVQTDLERKAYSVGKAVLGACSVGAPHIRQRLYFCAHAERTEQPRPINQAGWIERCGGDTEDAHRRRSAGEEGDGGRFAEARGSGTALYGADSAGERLRETRDSESGSGSGGDGESRECGDSEHGGLECEQERQSASVLAAMDGAGEPRESVGAYSPGAGVRSDSAQRGFAMHWSASGNAGHAALTGESGIGSHSSSERPEGHRRLVREHDPQGWQEPISRIAAASHATRGFWGGCDWWYGKDGKYRPIESGLFPLAHGASNRVLKLRGFGDAIVAPLAKEFIIAAKEVLDENLR